MSSFYIAWHMFGMVAAVLLIGLVWLEFVHTGRDYPDDFGLRAAMRIACPVVIFLLMWLVVVLLRGMDTP